MKTLQTELDQIKSNIESLTSQLASLQTAIAEAGKATSQLSREVSQYKGLSDKSVCPIGTIVIMIPTPSTTFTGPLGTGVGKDYNNVTIWAGVGSGDPLVLRDSPNWSNWQVCNGAFWHTDFGCRTPNLSNQKDGLFLQRVK